jgi:hypothetical protein
LVCPDGCNDCYYDSQTNSAICNSCNYDHAFNPSTKQCKQCSTIDEIGGNGCSECRYNTTTSNYQCLKCNEYPHEQYAYVINTFQCLSSTDSTKIGLYGCKTAYKKDSNSYECLECRYDFIPVKTDKSCIGKGSEGLSSMCLEAEKIGDKYSCTICDSSYSPTFVSDEINGIKNCEERTGEFSFCLEGTVKTDSSKICTKCVSNSALTTSKTCACNADSFSKDTKWCYQCDDDHEGNPGCDKSEGCTYTKANDELRCNKCLKGYFGYAQGQCYLCANEITNCHECHVDNTNNRLLCDSCKNSIYSVNSENKCRINDCQEYAEISPGCLICSDKLDSYLPNKKCQSCKYGYFKTKDDQCVYCKSEKYGGPACYECEYEGDNIVCNSCVANPLYGLSDEYNKKIIVDNKLYLSSDKKCFDCQVEFGDSCKKCGFTKDSDGSEKIRCTRCSPSYYLNSEGKCVKYGSLIQKIENCQTYNYQIANLNLTMNSYQLDYDDYGNYYDNYNNNLSITYNDIKGTIASTCVSCNSNYYLNDEGICEKITLDKCSFISILKNYNKFYSSCYHFSNSYDDYITVILPLSSHVINEYGKILNSISINNLKEINLNAFIKQFGESNDIKAILNYSEHQNDNSLKNCRSALYFPSNKSYICQSCQYDYILDNSTNICHLQYRSNDLYYNKKYYCNITNNGTQENPLYACDSYYYRNIHFTLVTFENNQKKFLEAKDELEGCTEAVGDTTYINSEYNCTKCSLGYALYYSKFFGRIICQNIKMKIKRKEDISLDEVDDIDIKVKINNETKKCDKEYLFTPDGENCYRCDNDIIGIPGCKGGCSFSLERKGILKCEGECKSGYIESSKGVCSECSAISKGCHECHYEDNTDNIQDSQGIIRKRNFVCDYCEEGYLKSPYGTCLDCDEDLDLDDCNRCEVDPNNSEKYICTQCKENYFFEDDGDGDGECEVCYGDEFKGLNVNKCIDCDDTEGGGIANCDYCELDGEKPKCLECRSGYILLSNNNTCLDIAKNEELQKFDNCLILTLDNNKFKCSKCRDKYSLVNNTECIYTPTLYDKYFYIYHQIYFYNTFKNKYNSSMKIENVYREYKENDFFYKQNIYLYPCEESINIGTVENPLYSCIKCYNDSYRHKYESTNYPAKVTDVNSKLSFCLEAQKIDVLEYCLEATQTLKDGKQIFNCTQCLKNYALALNKLTNTFYCKSTNATNKCVVLYCKNCNPHNGYNCEECLPDYEVSSASGSCVKKTEVIPAVTWKDIYRLNMNGEKKINNQYIHGPSLRMVGITSSQINTRHAFLIYLTFKIKVSTRYLEDNGELRIPAICEVVEGVEETSNDVNLVEYECIGNSTEDKNWDNYQLNNIEEDNNGNALKKSNLNEMVADMKEKGTFQNIAKTTSDFTYEDLIKIVIFQMKEKIDSIKATDFKFNFKIEGTLNKDIISETITLKREFDLAEVDTKANCEFTIRPDLTADLSCNFDVNNHKDIKTFSFKTAQVNTEDNEIYLSKLNDIVLINSEEDDDDNKTVIIVVIVVCCVVGAALIGVGIYFLVRKLKSAKKGLNMKNTDGNNKDVIKPSEINEGGESEGRHIAFQNK